MLSRLESLLVAAALAAVAACGPDAPGEVNPTTPTFQAVVDEVLTPKCVFGGCHNRAGVAAGLDLTPEAACGMLIDQPSCLFPERKRVVPGNPDDSFFFHKLADVGLHEKPTANCGFGSAQPTNALMPFGAAALDDGELRLVHDWIAAGAQCDRPDVDTTPRIESITASNKAPLAGETITITVTLDRPAPPAGVNVSLEANRSVLHLPLKAVVSGGATSAEVFAYADRPTSRFAVRARLGQSVRDEVLRVGGLEIAEVMTNPSGDDDQLQWIKLRNRTTQPIFLSGFRLQAGEPSYDLVGVPLTGAIPAGGCVVIGGPLQNGANSEPIFSQAIDFAPNLPYGGAQAAGFALFDGSAAPLGGITTPVDAMLVGASNGAQLLDPDGKVAAPGCATPGEGTSALRTETGCVQAQMQPRSCP